MMKYIATLLLTLSLTSHAWALDLQTAKQQHKVGEQPDGYIGAVVSSSEVQQLVQTVNRKRKQAYEDISKENGQPLNVVETLAAKKLYDKLAAGEYYQSADGSWKQK